MKRFEQWFRNNLTNLLTMSLRDACREAFTAGYNECVEDNWAELLLTLEERERLGI